ncbi:MAG: helix-turn-helix transcriptional regulator [Planctomycetes bacterium]|nr:helix-turn-helix transcriptional regulator [Planctomycetota bacterium]
MPSKKLVAASSEPIVLAILGRGESYGYEIIQRVRAASDGAMEWTDGMLYPVLHRLEERGWVAARWGASDSGRRRRYYRLTPGGERELAGQRAEWEEVNGVLQALWGGAHA